MNTNEVIETATKFYAGRKGAIKYVNRNYNVADNAELHTITTASCRLRIDYTNTKIYSRCDSHRDPNPNDTAILARTLFSNDKSGHERLMCYASCRKTKYFVDGVETDKATFESHLVPVNHRAGWTPKPSQPEEIRCVFPENIIYLHPPKSPDEDADIED